MLLGQGFPGSQVGGAAEEFRTRGALARTQAHLRAIMDREDMPLVQRHKFLWDRYRSVRQDIYVQGFDSATEVAMIEEHVRRPTCSGANTLSSPGKYQDGGLHIP